MSSLHVYKKQRHLSNAHEVVLVMQFQHTQARAWKGVKHQLYAIHPDICVYTPTERTPYAAVGVRYVGCPTQQVAKHAAARLQATGLLLAAHVHGRVLSVQEFQSLTSLSSTTYSELLGQMQVAAGFCGVLSTPGQLLCSLSSKR